MAKKFVEQQISENVFEIIHKEILALKLKEELDTGDAVKLEKFAKIYATLMSSHREDVKHGAFGGMTDDELEALLIDD